VLALADYAPGSREQGEDDDSPFSAVVRSKGWVSLDRFAKRGVYWSHAGRHFGLEIPPVWRQARAAAVLESNGQASAGAATAVAEKKKNSQLGETGQEEEEEECQQLVFIGTGMNEAAIREMLDGCLLTDEEMVKYEARRMAKAQAGFDPDMDLPPRRFAVGAAVEAFTGDGDFDGWSRGTVVGINYREDGWSPDEVAPYQIKLDNGVLIFAPMDDDRVVRLQKRAK